jgi:thiopeptide-type bacteriocin biosynthesis protein
VELSERLFHADSEAVLAIVELLVGDAGLDARWRLTLRGMDRLLDDLGLPLEERLELLRRVAASFAREHRADKHTEETLSARFRRERPALEALLDPARDAGSELEPGFELLAERSGRLAPIAAELREAQAQGLLTVNVADLAASYLHMHANRLLRGAARAQELVIYQFLVRLYESQLARRKRGR